MCTVGPQLRVHRNPVSASLTNPLSLLDFQGSFRYDIVNSLLFSYGNWNKFLFMTMLLFSRAGSLGPILNFRLRTDF